jgi:cytochrome d ubiquinol oxidase subunit I
LSTSSLSTLSLYLSISGFVVFYTGLLIAELYLMLKYARQGPGSLGTGRYANEPLHATTTEA